jgi:hypothetical protein
MQFSEWLKEQEALNEGIVQHPLTQRVVGMLQKYVGAASAEGKDLKFAAMIIRNRLKSVFGDLSKRPTEEQMRAAVSIVLRTPKLGVILAPLISPIPGTFLSLLILNMAFKRVFGIAILPQHFDQAFAGPNTMLGKMARRPA